MGGRSPLRKVLVCAGRRNKGLDQGSGNGGGKEGAESVSLGNRAGGGRCWGNRGVKEVLMTDSVGHGEPVGAMPWTRELVGEGQVLCLGFIELKESKGCHINVKFLSLGVFPTEMMIQCE